MLSNRSEQQARNIELANKKLKDWMLEFSFNEKRKPVKDSEMVVALGDYLDFRTSDIVKTVFESCVMVLIKHLATLFDGINVEDCIDLSTFGLDLTVSKVRDAETFSGRDLVRMAMIGTTFASYETIQHVPKPLRYPFDIVGSTYRKHSKEKHMYSMKSNQ